MPDQSRSPTMRQSLRAFQNSNDPSLIPEDGIFTPEQLCKLMGCTRQSLGYHEKPKPKNPRKQLRSFKKVGDNTHYFTPMEVYRFLTDNGYIVPKIIHIAIQNFNRTYGEEFWQEFKAQHVSLSSGTVRSTTELPPCAPNLHPKLSSGKYDGGTDGKGTMPLPNPLHKLVGSDPSKQTPGQKPLPAPSVETLMDMVPDKPITPSHVPHGPPPHTA